MKRGVSVNGAGEASLMLRSGMSGKPLPVAARFAADPLEPRPPQGCSGTGFLTRPAAVAYTPKRVIFAIALIFTFAVANTANAGTPNMHLTWTKVERAWTAAARKHGAQMDCPGLDATGGWTGGKIACHFTAGAQTWDASFQFFPTWCSISMSFIDTANRRVLGHQDISACKKGWWVAVASPWTYPPAQPRPMVG